jgi:hypothetical protein
MNAQPQATLPELERLLVVAAAGAARRRRWRWPVALGSFVAIGAVAAAAAGVFYGEGSTVDSGQTEVGTYVVEIKSDSKSTPDDEICLQLRLGDGRPAYGCGVAPSAAKPFGVLIASYASESDAGAEPAERIFYGLVTSEISRVSVLGEGDEHVDADTVLKPGLPGRYFSLIAPTEERIEIVGFNASGAEVARIGSREEPTHQPLSHDDAVAQGDPAGFAPTAVPVRHFSYQGEEITPEQASELGLVCVEGSERPPCYDSDEEAIAAGN